MKFLSLAVKTLRLAILRIGPGWMFGVLTLNFNRIAIHELGAFGFTVTTLIALHHFLAPLQVLWGHMADRRPIWGYRRSPYILLSGLVAALVFASLPWVAVALGNQGHMASTLDASIRDSLPATAMLVGQDPRIATFVALILLALFGVAMAANGNSAAALVVEVIDEKHRGNVFVVVWLTMIFSSIASAGITKVIMPVYDPNQMQFLYNLTLPIVIITSLIGLLGMEKRITPEEHAHIMATKRLEANTPNAFRAFWSLFNANPHVRNFFLFILFAIFGIFLQDAILEVFGAEVFGMTPGETASFTQYWGGGMLVGIALVAVVARIQTISKKTVAIVGGLGVAFGLSIIAFSALNVRESMVMPGLFLMGVSTGLFNIGALSLMMEMTVEGHTGLYMGMWGLAQGLGNGLANSLSGALHSGLIESKLLTPAHAYATIYGMEALVMVVAVVLLYNLSVQQFKGLSSGDIQATMVFESAA